MKKTPINPLKMSTKKDDKKKDKKDDDDSAISITPKRKRSASERRRSLAEIIKMKVKKFCFKFFLLLTPSRQTSTLLPVLTAGGGELVDYS